jgi:2-C-methyl-D-erythritol 4-phosphate cytidylyltransferase
VASSTGAARDISGPAGNVWAVLVAAGRGERLGEERPKSFAPLGGRALLAESVERLESSDWIDAIVVVAPEGWEEPAILLVEELTAGKVTATVTGGASRGESVRIGVGEVPEEAVAILVHDAARPLLPEEVVERLLSALDEGWDGVVPGLPVVDTVKRVDGDRVVETLPRGQLVAVQTPQVFVATALRAALDGDVEGASDCASLVEARGGRVRIVPGDRRLLKVTTRADLDLVQSWL